MCSGQSSLLWLKRQSSCSREYLFHHLHLLNILTFGAEVVTSLTPWPKACLIPSTTLASPILSISSTWTMTFLSNSTTLLLCEFTWDNCQANCKAISSSSLNYSELWHKYFSVATFVRYCYFLSNRQCLCMIRMSPWYNIPVTNMTNVRG